METSTADGTQADRAPDSAFDGYRANLLKLRDELRTEISRQAALAETISEKVDELIAEPLDDQRLLADLDGVRRSFSELGRPLYHLRPTEAGYVSGEPRLVDPIPRIIHEIEQTCGEAVRAAESRVAQLHEVDTAKLARERRADLYRQREDLKKQLAEQRASGEDPESLRPLEAQIAQLEKRVHLPDAELLGR